jgi:hypothetical protein
MSKTINTLEIGTMVKHSDPYHVRGASIGAIEAITEEQGWYRVWWESDGDNQIHPAARTYENFELTEVKDGIAN